MMMPRASAAKLAAAALAALVAAQAALVAQAQACEDQTEEAACVATSAGCLWQLTAEGAETFDEACVPCSEYDGSAWLCVSPCAYDEDAGTCGLSGPAAMPTAAPVSTDEETGVVETVVRLELGAVAGSSSAFSADQLAAVADIVNDVMAGQTAAVPSENDIERNGCGNAPLCGSADYMVDVAPIGNDFFIVLDTMEACCPARDTVAVESCQSVDLTGDACRVTGLQTPICADPDDPTAACLALSEDPESVNMTIASLVYTDGGATGGCCETCTCYGDPNCISFDGTKTSWRVCDARDPDSDTCQITKNACKSVMDTNGNACVWKPSSWESWWESGSPCQPSAGGEPSWLLMYQADDFGFFVRQEERGVIRQVYIITSQGNFSLDATDCVEHTALEKSWNYIGDGDWPSYTNDWTRVSSEDAFDVTWYIVDGDTNIQAGITCLGTVKPKDANKDISKQSYGNYRLNIDALIEPNDAWITERNNLDGFCYSNSLINEFSTETEIASLQEHLEIEALCAEKESVYDSDVALEMAQQLCGDGIRSSMQVECFEPFCENYASLATSSIDVDTCIEYFAGLEVAEGFCRVAFSSSANIERCLDDASEFNLTSTIATFLTSAGAVDSTCISSIDQLDTSLPSCTSGVTLQYQAVAGDESSWTDYKAFPSSRGLCSELSIPYVGNEILFTNPIRFEQCSRDPSCGPVEQCNWVDGVSIELVFGLGDRAPSTTFSPTVYPTTLSPTAYPTSLSPTPAPVCTSCVEKPEVQVGVSLDSDVCESSIAFTADDIDTQDLCYTCDFTNDGAIRSTGAGDGSYFSLGDACEIADDNTEALEDTCAELCAVLQNQGCSAWVLMGGDCFVNSCEDNEPVFVDGVGSGAEVCDFHRTPGPTAFPTRFPTPRTGSPTAFPTSFPTESPTNFPTTAPTRLPTSECNQEVCLTGEAAPAVQDYIIVDEDVCVHDIFFTADDLPSDEFCYCDFTDDDIRVTGEQNGNYVYLMDACDLASENYDDLNEVCAHVCELLDGCDAWVIGDGACFLFSCDDSADTSDYFVEGSYRGAPACPSCTQEVCLAGEETPEIQVDVIVDEDICVHDIFFSADDLDVDEFCYSCEFSSDNILTTGEGNGNYVVMTDACDISSDDTDGLDAVCGRICELVDGCDAWVQMYGQCYIFSCDGDVDEYFVANTNYNAHGAAACPEPPTPQPTPQPFGWGGRRALKASMLKSTEQHVPRVLTNLPVLSNSTRKPSADEIAKAKSRALARAPRALAISASDPDADRRELRTPGSTEFFVTSRVMFTDGESATASMNAVANVQDSTVAALQSAFDNSDALSGVTVTGIVASPEYDYYILRFNVPYVESEHTASDFLSGLCFVVQRTVYRRRKSHDMGLLKCEEQLFNFTSYEESDGDLAVYFRIASSSVDPGDFQTVFGKSATRATFDTVLEECSSEPQCDVTAITDLVSTLKASFLSAGGGEGASDGGLGAAGTAMLCIVLVGSVLATGLFLYRRRVVLRREEKQEQKQKQLAATIHRHYGYDEYDDEYDGA